MTTFSAVQKVIIEACKRFNMSQATIGKVIMAATEEDLDFLNQAYLASDREAALLIINKYN